MSPDAHVADHFATAETQRQAATLGMWLFLGTEALLFGGLFVLYAAYRFTYGSDFIQIATREMELGIGTVNTFVLLVSSVFVAYADVLVKRGKSLRCAGSLSVAVLLGVLFLVLKGVEYAHHVEHGALPGQWYALHELPMPGANIFMTLYFIMTGIHAVHVTVGICVLSWIAFQAAAGEYGPRYHTPVEVSGMYWHLVDVIWVFLYPLFYLLSRK